MYLFGGGERDIERASENSHPLVYSPDISDGLGRVQPGGWECIHGFHLDSRSLVGGPSLCL